MAKKSTKTETIQKISNEELEQLQFLQKSISNAVNNLATVEIAKYEILNEHASLKQKMQTLSLDLEEKYGKINISLLDGTISEITEEV